MDGPTKFGVKKFQTGIFTNYSWPYAHEKLRKVLNFFY